MKFNFSKEDLTKLNKLILFKDMNIASNEAIYQFFFENLNYKNFFKWLNLNLKDKENLLFKETYFNNPFKQLNNKTYEDEEYAKVLNGIKFQINEYSLNNLILKEGNLIPFNDIKVEENNYYIEHSEVGYFPKNFSYIALSKDDVVWMSLDPSEINTMKPIIQNFKGNVLVFGLGLGYFPYLLLSNNNVKSVTIIEKDKEIISLYKKYIYPHIDGRIAFNIIEADAYDFIKENDMNNYDSFFVDIWHNANDGFHLYHHFIKLLPNTENVFYWLENSLICMFRRLIITVIQEELEGFKDKDFNKTENEYDEYLKIIHFKYKDKTFNTYDDLYEFLSFENLKSILKDI